MVPGRRAIAGSAARDQKGMILQNWFSIYAKGYEESKRWQREVVGSM